MWEVNLTENIWRVRRMSFILLEKSFDLDCAEEIEQVKWEWFFFIFWKSRSCLLSTEAFISALNLHAIGNKHGNLFYEHFVLWPVAPFFNHYSQINVFSASNDFLPQHRPDKSRLRNQNHWILCSVTIQYFSQIHCTLNVLVRCSWTKVNGDSRSVQNTAIVKYLQHSPLL